MKQRTQLTNGHFLFYGLLTVLLGLCVIRYALQINIPLVLLLIVSVLIASLGDRNEVVTLCICMVPLVTSVQHNYVLMCCIILFLLKFKRDIHITLVFLPVLGMILWELLHCYGGPFSPVSFVCNFLPQLLLLVLMCSGDTGYDYDFVVRTFAVCVAGVCLQLLTRVLYTANFNISAALLGLQRLGLDAEKVSNITITGGQQNPNTLGIQCVLAITGLVQMRFAGRKHLCDTMLLLLLLIFGALTSSRTYIVCLVTMAILFVLCRRDGLLAKLKLLGGITLALLVMVLTLYTMFPDLLEYYINRFLVEDITTGRDKLMIVYNDFILSQPSVLLFGIGLQNFGDRLIEYYRVAENVPHNSIQELVIAWGLPGVFLFAALILQ